MNNMNLNFEIFRRSWLLMYASNGLFVLHHWYVIITLSLSHDVFVA